MFIKYLNSNVCVDVKIRLKVPSKYFLNLIFTSSCHAFFLADYMSVCTLLNRETRKSFGMNEKERLYRCHRCKIISFPWRISSRTRFMIIRIEKGSDFVLLEHTRITLGGFKNFGMLVMLMLFTIYV